MSEWQPIETAPKDGIRVIIYVPAYIRTVIVRGKPIKELAPERIGEAALGAYCGNPNEWAWANDSCDCCYGSINGTPTHWMPLPKPPEAANGS